MKIAKLYDFMSLHRFAITNDVMGALRRIQAIVTVETTKMAVRSCGLPTASHTRHVIKLDTSTAAILGLGLVGLLALFAAFFAAVFVIKLL
ncbi:MAG: hypothetical protein H6948_02975 [Zoogloeaceae bacterium]|nr:hypothetical protein [Zoogloeaceae bacterium]